DQIRKVMAAGSLQHAILVGGSWVIAEAKVADFEWTPRPVDRASLFARSGPLRGPARRSAPGARVDARHAAQAIHALPALTRAQNIHVLLVATPGRQARLTATGTAMLRLELFRSHASDWAMVVSGRGFAESSAWTRCGGESALDG